MSVPPPANGRLSISELVASRDMLRDESYALQTNLTYKDFALKALRREHAKKERRMNTDMEDKYENEDEKKKAEQEIEGREKALEELKEEWQEAKALYRQSEQVLKEAEQAHRDRSWCTIS
jgi:predicted ribosome quality control (RQC) complex YloA/Tae2 family protein